MITTEFPINNQPSSLPVAARALLIFSVQPLPPPTSFFYSYTQYQSIKVSSVVFTSFPPNSLTNTSYHTMSNHFFPIAVLVAAITAFCSATTAAADTPDCPYPCLPPPTSGGVINSYPPPPPSGSSGSGGASGGGGLFSGSYPPPPPGGFQMTPPGGVMPGGAFAPPFGGGFPTGPAPPPPNPILPWFPWYYQHNNPITGSTTSAAAVAGWSSTASVVTVVLLSVFLVGDRVRVL
uniref:Uncharacterized protein n=1 Tax=Leersia perrieri TaxID=77586 RepID=A0A0D9XCM3_9ORYZ